MTNTIKFLDYKERPAFSPPAAAYHQRCLELGAGIEGQEFSYGPHDLQRLIVYPAADPNGEVLLAFHGGRFSHGYKEWIAMMAPPLNQRGITLVTGGHRLIPEPFPAGLEDCASALRWVADNLDRFGGRSDAIFLSGHSSGGYYATMAALRSEALGLDTLPAVAGCLPISGLFRMEPAMPPGTLLFPEGADPETYIKASPLEHDLRTAPPFHITWGGNDLPPIPDQSTAMVDALGKAGGHAEAFPIDGADHFDTHYAAAEMDGAWIRSAANFMAKHRA